MNTYKRPAILTMTHRNEKNHRSLFARLAGTSHKKITPPSLRSYPLYAIAGIIGKDDTELQEALQALLTL
jgi:hypothetical protein